MILQKTHKTITYFIAAIWIINGLFCKVLNLIPRHEQIVSKIIDRDHSQKLTILIGVLEILMAIWILSSIKSKLNTVLQIIIVAVMNTLEFTLVPDLLLWGKFNAVFALIFILIVYFNNFYMNTKIQKKPYAIIS
ncbi:DoxX-like family protein [Flavivirga amylovorans]|uniref:DoxX-like family protein n=1 Tax=Flavivirga amylovorans TaxID=870486 RepID=A0ABT8WWA0_9FLAO|nr:DoxX-like family protein [Flavivirga amylovorans]MDO5985961.1 DoxX-like family protein [Flavivirga amylovorans]